MKKPAPLFLSLILAACAADNLATGLPALEGKPIAEAIGFLGPTANKQEMNGETVYVWTHEETGSYDIPAAMTSPSIGPTGQVYSRNDLAMDTQTYTLSCRIEISTHNGLISATHYEGGPGCHTFSEKLAPLAKK